MKKEHRLPVLLLLLTTLGLYWVERSKPIEIDWSPSYYRNHTQPFGTFLLHESIKEMWPRKKVEYIDRNFFDWARENTSRSSDNLLIINDIYDPDEVEVKELMLFVERGNTVFIAAEALSVHLGQELGIDSIMNSESRYTLQDVTKANNGQKESYFLKRYKRNFQGAAPFGSSFKVLKDSSITVLGTSLDGDPNFIKKDHGSGSIYFIGTPAFFSNYGMLHAINRDYIFGALSHLPSGNFIWNDYHTNGFPKSMNPLRYLRSQPPLWWAYCSSLVFALFWVLFKAKRNQRIIPIIPPIKNESLDFLKIVGRVYFRKGDHRDLADKKIRFFFEQLRTRWLIAASTDADATVIDHIASKTGYDLEKTQLLFELIRSSQQNSTLQPSQLVKLHRAISHFYQETQMYGKP